MSQGHAPRVTYLVNLYPAVSHTFIRREIQALERRGVEVQRIALRGWDGTLVDPQDEQERMRTKYVLRGGLTGLLAATLGIALRRPLRLLRTIGKALTFSRDAFRPWPYHLVYVAEACLVTRWAEEAGSTHLHAHFGSNAAEVAALVQALGGPSFSFTVHGPTEFDQPVQHKLREKVQAAAFVVAISSYGKSQLLRWARPQDWHKVHVVHCGIEPAVFAPAPETSPQNSRLVCVGRLCGAKGQLLLVEAAARLVQEGFALELVLAGDGEMRPEVEARVSALGLSGYVRLTGWLTGDQVRSELVAARALVLPSFAEGLPVVIMESMAVARPVISTFVAGIPELVRPGENGWLVPAGDIEELARAMKACLQASETDLRSMGLKARARVVERHSIDTETGKLLYLLQRLP